MIHCAECHEPIPTTVPQVTIIGIDVRHVQCSPPNQEIIYVWGWMAQRSIENALATDSKD